MREIVVNHLFGKLPPIEHAVGGHSVHAAQGEIEEPVGEGLLDVSDGVEGDPGESESVAGNPKETVAETPERGRNCMAEKTSDVAVYPGKKLVAGETFADTKIG